MAHDERIPPVEPEQPTRSESDSPPGFWLPEPPGVPASETRASSSELDFGRLTQEQALALAREAGLTDEGIKHLIKCRDAPSRNVRGGHGNKRGEYFSRKNGHPVQYESFTCEWPVAQGLEADPKVVWYGCQPPPVACSYAGPNDKRQRRRFRSDYLYLKDDGSVHEIECKLLPEVEELLVKKPHLYARDENNVVYRPPLREALGEMGIQHHVAIPGATDLLLARNAVYLDPYSRRPLSKDIARQIQEALRYGPLQAVVLATRTTGNIDDVLKAVAQDYAFIDLQRFPAWETEVTLVHRSRESMSAFVHLADRAPVVCDVVPPLGIGGRGTWDGKPYSVTYVGETRVFLRCDDGAGGPVMDMPIAEFDRLVREGAVVPATKEVQIKLVDRELERYHQLTDDERAVATDRSEAVRNVQSGRYTAAEAATLLGVSVRQMYRYLRLYEGNDPSDPEGGFAALAPKFRNSGHRGHKLPDDVMQRLDASIKNNYFRENRETLPRPTVTGAYRLYREQEGAAAVSRKTFSKRVKALTNVRNTAFRDGQRVANQKRVSRGQDPDEAVYPFQQIQIDGTVADVLLDLFGQAAGECWIQRPTLTPMYDCYSTACVGFSCLFGAESSVTAMMAIRHSVQLHGRLADVLFADNAGAHKSDVVRNLIVGLGGGDLRFRPSGRPEFGGQVEQLIKSCTQELLSELAGYTERLKAVRTLTKSHDPARDVMWSLEALNKFLEFFFFKFYNRRMHPGVGAIPEQRLQEGLALRGSRESQRVKYNERFVIATMPTAKRKRILSRENGVYLHSVRYRNPAVCAQLHGNIELGKDDIRYDPEDLSRIFVLVDDQFEAFTSGHADLLSRYSVGEAQALSRAWPAKMAEARRARRNDDSPMARFLLSVHDEQESRKARMRTETNQRANPASSSHSLDKGTSSSGSPNGTGASHRWIRFGRHKPSSRPSDAGGA